MLLFLQTFKNSLKEKTTILIFTILSIISTILFTVSWTVDKRLYESYRFMGGGTFDYDYILRYEGKKLNKDSKNTISPWFAFDSDYFTIKNLDGTSETLPYLALGDHEALKPLSDSNIDIKFDYETIGGQLEMTDITFTNKDPNKVFSFHNDGLYQFNTDSDKFKNSLIGKLYLQDPQNSIVKINKFMNNFAYSDISNNTINLFISYLKSINTNFDNKSDDKYKKQLLGFINPNGAEKRIKNVDLSNSEDVSKLPLKEDVQTKLFTEKLNGELTVLYKTISPADNSVSVDQYYTLFDNLKPDVGSSIMSAGYNKNLANAVFTVQDLYKSTVNHKFENNDETQRGPYYLVQSYYGMLGSLAQFDIKVRNSFNYWDLSSQFKYKIIDWEEPAKYNQIKILDKVADFDFDDPISDYVIITPQFARARNLVLGDPIQFGSIGNTYYVGAFGGDSANIYPTIYDDDIFPNTSNEAIVYVPTHVFRMKDAIATNEDIEETSALYLTYTGKDNSNEGKNIFEKYLASNFKHLDKNSNDLKDKSNTESIYMRYALMGKAIKTYTIATITLVNIFLLILICTISILIKKIINEEKVENGILKANGYSPYHIACTYLVYGLIVTLIGVPIGYFIGTLLQIPIIDVFNHYFIMPNHFKIYYEPFLISFFSILLLSSITIIVTGILQLRKNTLNLINPSRDHKQNKLIESIKARHNFQKFSSRFRFVIFGASLKKISWFSITMFFASMAVTFASLIPASIYRTSKDFFGSLNYNNEYGYKSVIGNVPLSRMQLFNWTGPSGSESLSYPIQDISLVADYYRNVDAHGDLGPWLSTAPGGDISKDIDRYAPAITNMIMYNLIVGKGTSLSVGFLVDLFNRFNQNRTIYNRLNILACSELPMAFGHKGGFNPPGNDPLKRWNYCLQQATEDFLPAKIKELWHKDKNNGAQFSLTFGTTPLDNQKEDVYTGYNSNIKINDSDYDIATYGISGDNTSVLINEGARDVYNPYNIEGETDKNKVKEILDKINKGELEIPTVISKQMANRFNYGIGTELDASITYPALKFLNKDNTYQKIDPNWWFYCDDNCDNEVNSDTHKVNIYDLDLTKMAINKNIAKSYGYFDKETQKPQQYKSLDNIYLKIPKDFINADEFSKQIFSDTTGNKLPRLFNTSGPNSVVKQVGDYYLIRPFDTKYDQEISSVTSLTKVPTNWYRTAFKLDLFKVGGESKSIKYIVKGIQSSYDELRMYVSQRIANSILDFNLDNTSLVQNGKKPYLWFNGKFSSFKDPVDQTMFYNTTSETGVSNIIDFMQFKLSESIGRTDYIGIKRDVFKKLAFVSITLAAIFIAIVVVTAIIIIYLMTDSFVNGFIRFIAVMKSMGYRNREISRLTIGVFTPFVLLSWAIGVLIMWWTVKLSAYGFMYYTGRIFPLNFEWLILPITFIIVVGIYVVAYYISVYKIKKMSMQKQLMAYEV